MKNKILIDFQEDLEKPIWFDNVEKFVLLAMEKLNFTNEEVSILFCNNSYIQELNNSYRNINSPTDVLSFENDYEYEEDGIVWKTVGDIAISIEMITENAKYFNTTDNDELKRLLVHGLLHLNGMDHGEEHIENGIEPKCKMLILQEQILKEMCDQIIIK